jgi:N-acetylmuramate 1-kinase
MTVESRHPEVIPPQLVRYLLSRGLDGSAKVIPLTGDASARRYFRVIRRDQPSFVLALHDAPFDFESLPFVNVARLLECMQLPIPRILDHVGELGLLALDDLGDVTLQAHLGAAPPAEHSALYRQALGFIEVLQRRGRALESPKYIPYGIVFDVQKLTWELDFFVRHFIEGYRGVPLAAGAATALRQEWESLAEELAAEERVLCHRDFHSRNLMLHEGRLVMIDFQDARMGPDTYDLVSLLRDSYVDMTEEAADDLIAYFLALRDKNGHTTTLAPSQDDERQFRRRFDVVALQRNLKALGTFGYQTTRLGNPVYIQYIPRTLRYVRLNLARHARFGRLRELLATLLDELQ